ncbi:uncharacterized protein MONOS_4546 [Monocercomonoides exilis]|uniref:uncharacterized protein n=1 Tax=Monocercomonoides exilis TaxID=2049356 RepID=UPI00355AA03E|nr:hypothetical protein MONOS_4546 [Monocercomonoides exilis]|eukprot:MONOS_4546.1-p1 / transcript=MONOS_4546.1 / gene=MONOS_4546 / organism=Monocercomonoides_exilis_PA203 / gene_product=unspecified product / transcript_product=unspecified product / location=Mono_scaffold00122:24104-24529(+) / protein_length=119 / sequence_SO=supercontig / SO=protein_coding / is_pseudo=false
MEKAFTFKPELEHVYEVHKAPPPVIVSKVYSVGMVLLFAIFLIMITFVGLRSHKSSSLSGKCYYFGFFISLLSAIAVITLYWFNYYLLFPEIIGFSVSALGVMVFGKLYFEEQRKLVV